MYKLPHKLDRYKHILSLFDYTGNWSKPYRESGYQVTQIDIKLGIDILNWNYKELDNIYGILAAVPCTHFAISGARWFAEKDRDGRTEEGLKLVDRTLEIINYFNPHFWAIENPMSRIHKLRPQLGQPLLKFHPYDFAQYDLTPFDSQYSKMTWLWGEFNLPIEKPLPNIQGTKHWLKLGGKSERTKELRSITPLGFAYAFYGVNQ